MDQPGLPGLPRDVLLSIIEQLGPVHALPLAATSRALRDGVLGARFGVLDLLAEPRERAAKMRALACAFRTGLTCTAARLAARNAPEVSHVLELLKRLRGVEVLDLSFRSRDDVEALLEHEAGEEAQGRAEALPLDALFGAVGSLPRLRAFGILEDAFWLRAPLVEWRTFSRDPARALAFLPPSLSELRLEPGQLALLEGTAAELARRYPSLRVLSARLAVASAVVPLAALPLEDLSLVLPMSADPASDLPSLAAGPAGASLSRLSLSGNFLPPSAGPALAQLTNLTSLSLRIAFSFGPALRCLAGLPRLAELSVSVHHCRQPAAMLSHLSDAADASASLDRLAIAFAGPGMRGELGAECLRELAASRAGPRLRRLAAPLASATAVLALRKFPALESLSLEVGETAAESLPALPAALPRLAALALRLAPGQPQAPVGDAALAAASEAFLAGRRGPLRRAEVALGAQARLEGDVEALAALSALPPRTLLRVTAAVPEPSAVRAARAELELRLPHARVEVVVEPPRSASGSGLGSGSASGAAGAGAGAPPNDPNVHVAALIDQLDSAQLDLY
eukprot:tig00020592_g11684.t1